VSRENVELVRQALEAAFHKPKPEFETVNTLFDPEHELISMLSQIEGRSFRGAAGFREWMAFMDEGFGQWEASLESVEDLSDDRVLLISVVSAQSRMGEVPIEQRLGFVVTVRNGKVARTEGFSSADEARAAARGG
jgi:ketosteroid isomerase-like protein